MANLIEGVKVGEKIIEGKTKIVYEIKDDEDACLLVSKDRVTAGDGAKAHDLEGKAAISTETTCKIFEFLNFAGIKSHYLRKNSDISFFAKKCNMIPIEFVTRRIATGSFLKRNVGVPEGYKFCPVKLETFYKDDANHDPQWSHEQLVSSKMKKNDDQILTERDVKIMYKISVAVFELLEKLWSSMNCQLIDMKIEFGVDSKGQLILSDVIDSDSWRLWPGGDKRLMKDKQLYRDMQVVTNEGLEQLKLNFKWVAEKLHYLKPKVNGKFVVFMGSPTDLEFCKKLCTLSSVYGIECDLRICSGHKVPCEVLDILANYEGLLTPVVIIAVAGRSNALGPLIAGNTCLPVINCPPLGPDWVSKDLWSSIHVPSGIGCVSVLSPENAIQSAAHMLALNDIFVWAKLRGMMLEKYVSLIRADETINP